MIIDITSFGDEPSLDQPIEGGVIDITPEGFNSPVEEIEEINPEEETVEEEETTENEEVEESSENEDLNIEESDDEEEETEYSEARQYFEQATTLNILQTPEDFEWDENDPLGSIEKATEYTNNILLKQVQDNFYSQFKDPLLQQIVDTALQGGSFLDVSELVNKTGEVNSYENMDITNEDQASKLYEDYLKETTKFKSNKIKRLVDIAKDDDELIDLAAEAKEYFIDKSFENIRAQVQEAERLKKQQEEQAKEYWTGFNNTLSSSNLSTPVKERVRDSFSLVESNGQKTLKYQDTFNRVSQNPEHFIDLLVFLNSYDPQQGFNFEREVKKVASQQANTFKERLEKAISTKTSAGKSTTKNRSRIVPKRSDYQKNIRRY